MRGFSMSTHLPSDKEKPKKTWAQRLKEMRNAFSSGTASNTATEKSDVSTRVPNTGLDTSVNKHSPQPISTRPILIAAKKAKEDIKKDSKKRRSTVIGKPASNLQDLPKSLNESELMQRKRKKESDQEGDTQSNLLRDILETLYEAYGLKSDKEMSEALKKETEKSLEYIFQDLLRIGSHPYYEVLASRDEDEFNFILRNLINQKVAIIEKLLGKDKCEKIAAKMLDGYSHDSGKEKDLDDLKAYYKLALGIKNIRYGAGSLAENTEVSKKINLLVEELEKRLGKENVDAIKVKWDLQAKQDKRTGTFKLK